MVTRSLAHFMLFFCLGLGIASGARADKVVAVATPLHTPAATLSIADATLAEGNGLYRDMAFTVSVSRAQSRC